MASMLLTPCAGAKITPAVRVEQHCRLALGVEQNDMTRLDGGLEMKRQSIVRRRPGFTLIELLVVIAIVAILAAILFPVFVQAKERGRQAVCCSNLKQLTQAFFNYCDDNNGYMPGCQRRQLIAAGWPSNVRDWTGSRWVAYGTPPAPCDVREGPLFRGGYARSIGIFNCPSDKDMPAIYGTTKIGFSEKASLDTYFGGVRPSGVPNGLGITYSLNEDVCHCSKSGSPTLRTVKLALATAGRGAQVLFLLHEYRGQLGVCSGQNDGWFQWWSAGSSVDMSGKIHWDGSTCSYADGHVKWISNKEMTKIVQTPHASHGSAPCRIPWHRNSYFYGTSNPAYNE